MADENKIDTFVHAYNILHVNKAMLNSWKSTKNVACTMVGVLLNPRITMLQTLQVLIHVASGCGNCPKQQMASVTASYFTWSYVTK